MTSALCICRSLPPHVSQGYPHICTGTIASLPKPLHLAPNLLLAIPSNLACCSLPPELLLPPRVRAVWMYWGTGQKTRSTTWHAGTWTSSLSAPQHPATQWEGAARTHKSCLGLSQQDGAGAPVPVTLPTSAHFAQSNPKYLLHPLKPQK